MKATKVNYEASKKYLLDLFKDDVRVYTKLNNTSSSGMTRHISVYVVRNNEILNITYDVGIITDYRQNSKDGGLIVGGCGMDMGFHLIYTLSYNLYPDGFKLAKGQYGRNGDTSGYDRDGGYRLKQQWL
jgi:hypothetical protein